jgi:2-oxoglutarate ferredoxin oxidoreductase subunit alpha
VTRGTSRDEYAVYTEDGEAYRRNMDRLIKKWNAAKEIVPAPEFYQENNFSEYGVLFFGTSTYAAEETIELLKQEQISLDAMRVKAFPFGEAFADFINSHEKIFVIEQNRDAQFRSLMMIELGVNPEKIVSVLNYDGTPITADNILNQIKANLQKTESNN